MKPLINYLVASRAELAKVVWPNRRQTIHLSIVVIIYSVILAAILGAFDFGFSTLIQKLIIKG